VCVTGVQSCDLPNSLRAMGNLAITMYEQGDYARARAVFEEVLAMFRRKLGPEHPDTLRTMGNLAETMHALGEIAPSRSMFEAVLDVVRRTPGPSHPETRRLMGEFAETIKKLGEDDLAAHFHELASTEQPPA
jgi:hypothetical protein